MWPSGPPAESTHRRGARARRRAAPGAGYSPHKLALLAGTGITRRLDASLSAVVLAGERFGYDAYGVAGVPVGRNYGAEMQVNAFVSYKDLLFPGSFVGLGVHNLANAKTLLIQPYDNGHPPMPGPSREVFLRIGCDFRRQTHPQAER